MSFFFNYCVILLEKEKTYNKYSATSGADEEEILVLLHIPFRPETQFLK